MFMNKKVLTLCAGFLLAGGVNAFAQTPAVTGAAKSFETGKAYILSDGTNALAVQAATKGDTPKLVTVAAPTATSTLENLQKALWRVVVAPGTNGSATTYTFMNVYTGTPLAINSKVATTAAPTAAADMAGDIISWQNNPAYNPIDATQTFPIYHEYTYASKDSAYVLVTSSTNVGVRKVAANEVSSMTTAFKALPVIAPGVVLTANDLNTNLHADESSTSFQLTFNPDVQNAQWGNVLAGELIAEPGNMSYAGSVTASEYVRLKDATPNSKKYVYVDTAYVATENVAVGNRHLKLALAEPKLTANPADNFTAIMTNRSNFKFTYFATNDSITIAAGNATDKNALKGSSKTSSTDDETWKDWMDGITSWGAADNEGETQAENWNLVKLTYLTEETASTAAHSEITVGNAEQQAGAPSGYTLRTCISLGLPSNLVPGTPADGVYLIRVKANGANAKDKDGRYYINNLAGNQELAIKEVRENYQDMPATQWVVTSVGNVATIKNREFANDLVSTAPMYTDGTNYFYLGQDTLQFIPVEAAKIADEHLGYKYVSNDDLRESVFTFNYLHELLMDQPINTKMESDSTVWVDKNGEKMTFSLERLVDDEYGYTGDLAGVADLTRSVYYIKVTDASKLENNGRYLVYDEGRKQYVVSNYQGVDFKSPYSFLHNKTNRPTPFFLKENNEVEGGECYYTLVVANIVPTAEKVGDVAGLSVTDENLSQASSINAADGKAANVVAKTYTSNKYASAKVSVDNNTLALVNGVIADGKTEEVANSAFAVIKDDSPLYRRFNNAELGENANDAPSIQKFYRVNSTNREYLYEDANSKYSEGLGMNFLGVEGKGDNANAAMYVDTAYVNRDTRMPQYMLVLNPQIVKADTIWCNATSTHTHATLADSLACPHTTILEGSVTGRYLINLQDSVDANVNPYDNKFVWNRNYTRLAFVDAKHVGDTLVIFRDGKPSTAAADSIFLGDNKHKNVVFSFRYVDNNTENFLIESETEENGTNVKNSALTTVSIAPNNGGWVKIQNGVPVIANMTYEEAALDAEIFNTEVTEEAPTANESIAANNAVSVVATDGAVIVKGAEGKNVVVSTILGKVVANEVLNSDNETIAAPAGIVVVSVDGESFKVAVK